MIRYTSFIAFNHRTREQCPMSISRASLSSFCHCNPPFIHSRIHLTRRISSHAMIAVASCSVATRPASTSETPLPSPSPSLSLSPPPQYPSQYAAHVASIAATIACRLSSAATWAACFLLPPSFVRRCFSVHSLAQNAKAYLDRKKESEEEGT